MDTVRIGIVGIGNMGSAHAANIFAGNIKGLTLGAVCDIDPEKRRWAQEQLPGVSVYERYTDMLDSAGLDAILVAVPHYLHPEVCAAGFAHGLHVLSEKPAGVYTNQVKAMYRAAEKAGTVFGIMFNQRTNPLFQKARELVQNGWLGEPKRLVWIITNWYRPQAYYNSGGWRATWGGEGGGVLLNQAPHNLDLWQWIFGVPQRVRAFCAYGKYHRVEVEDDVTIYAEYDTGATATFITTTGEHPGTNRLEISGDRGKLVIEDGVMKLWELKEPERVFCFESSDSFRGPDTTYSEWRPDRPETAHSGILQNFTNAILHGEALLAPGFDGIHSLQISNAAYLSDWTGEPVSLPVDGDRFEELLGERVLASQTPEKGETDHFTPGAYSPRWQVRW